MAFTLAQEDGVLRVVYSGVITVDERTQALSTTFQTSPLTQGCRVLVDFRQASATLPASNFDTTRRFVDLLARETKGGASRVAYLSESEMPIDRCIEMLIESRRLPIKRFTDEDAAMEWLQESWPH